MNINKYIYISLLLICFFSVTLVSSNDQTNESNSTTTEDAKKEEDLSKIIDGLHAYKLRSEEELRFLTELTDFTILLFLYKPQSPNSKKAAKHLKPIMEKLNNLAAFALINCDTFTPSNYYPCHDYDYVLDSFPRLKLLIPPEKRYDAVTKQFEVHQEYPYTEKEITENLIYNFITHNMPNKAVKVRKDTVYSFLYNDLFNKIILFTNKREQSVMWRGLTNNFHDRILFGEVYKSDKEMLDRFNVTKFPTLLLYKVHDKTRLLDEPEIVKYDGPIQADKLIEWIQPHLNIQKHYISQRRQISDLNREEMQQNIIIRTINRTTYEDYFNHYPNKTVLVYFHTKNNIKTKVKSRMITSHGFFISAFFDCNKDRQFCLEKFGITKFPMLKLVQRVDSTQGINSFEDRLRNMKTIDISKNSPHTFEDQIRQIFPSKVENVTSLDYPYKISNAKFEDKYVVTLSYTDEDEMYLDTFQLDLLSNDPQVSKDFVFYLIKNPTSEVSKMNNFPSKSGIFVFYRFKVDDEYRLVQFGKDVFYSSLYYVTTNIVYLKYNMNYIREFDSDYINHIRTPLQFRKECTDHEHCALLFIDARPSQENLDIFNDIVSKVTKVKLGSTRYEKVRFNWVNATCHDYLAEKFETTTDLPGIIFYYSWRGTFTKFIGLKDNFIISDFFERSLNDRITAKEINKDDLYFKKIVCEDVLTESEIVKTEPPKSEAKKSEPELKMEVIKENIERENTEKPNNEAKIDL